MPAPSQRFATIGVRLIALYFLVYGGAGLIDAALTKARFLWITADLFSDSEDLPASFSENEDEEGEVIGITSRAEQSFAIY
ncbi:MAG: hypothetical protein R3F11_30430, partial [Verrucomicrobiales bacterium]